MKTKKSIAGFVSAVLIAGLVLGMVAIPVTSPVSAANTWYVNPPDGGDGVGSDLAGNGSLANPWETIKNAIGNASVGDTIIVMNGTAEENVSVDEQLTIQSQNGYTNTTVKPLGTTDDVFHVTADYVEIRGFTIMSPCEEFQFCGVNGVNLSGADYCTISNNEIVANVDLQDGRLRGRPHSTMQFPLLRSGWPVLRDYPRQRALTGGSSMPG